MKPRYESTKCPNAGGYICLVKYAWHSEVGPGSVGVDGTLIKYWLGDVEIWATRTK